MRNIFVKIFLLLVQMISVFFRMVSGPACRFSPSCSQYACEAAKQHSFWYAMMLIAKRLFRCHPLHAGGYDPIPERKSV